MYLYTDDRVWCRDELSTRGCEGFKLKQLKRFEVR